MPEKTDVNLRVPFTTLLKIAFFMLLVMAILKLWPVILMMFIAIMLSAMLAPVVRWLERHRVRRGWAVAAVAIALLGVIGLIIGLVVPAMASQLKDLSKNAPQIKAELLHRAPYLRQLLTAPHPTQINGWIMKGLAAGMFALEGITAMLFVLVISIYLLIEGSQAFEWLLALSPERHRQKLRRTADEASDVAIAYMRGNIISSFLCAGWVLLVTLILHIPAAVPLAVIAFIADFVPVAGTIVMTIPAVLLALSVSPAKAIMVVIAYLLYHLLENYLIIPRVYGKSMRLSTLTVLLAVTAGGVLQGIIGAVLVLPFVAAYPIIERIWLREHLPSDTVPKHEAIEEETSSPSETTS